MSDFGRTLMPEWIILAREARGITQKQLKAQAAVPYIADIEAGEVEMTPDELRRVAEALDFPVSFFLRRDELPLPSLFTHCGSSEQEAALAEEAQLRARLRRRVSDLSARSLRDALHAIQEVADAEKEQLLSDGKS